MTNDNISLANLYDMNIGKSLLKQLAFDHMCEHYSKGWKPTELNGEPAMQIPGLGIFPHQILGSEAGGTWLWAWANDTIPSTQANLSSHFLTTLEDEFAIKGLSDAELPMDTINGHYLVPILVGMYDNVSGCFAQSINDDMGVSYSIYIDIPLKNMTQPVSTVRVGKVLGTIFADARVENKLQAAYSFMESIGFALAEEQEDEAIYKAIYRDSEGREIEIKRETKPFGNYELSYSLTHTHKDVNLEEYGVA